MVDLGCPGETVETTAAISSGTFVLLLRLRRAGVLSSAVEEIEEGTPELFLPVFLSGGVLEDVGVRAGLLD
jgi:hypothetical protein